MSFAVSQNKETGMSRGFGFVQFGSREAYTAAISQSEHVLDKYKVLSLSVTWLFSYGISKYMM